MDTTHTTTDSGAFDRRDELISRVIDGEATEQDWTALRSLAQSDPSVWTDLTATQRQHEALADAVEAVGMIADGVEIPEGELLSPHERFQRRMDGVRAWGGWAAAAAILLVWFTGLPSPTATHSPLNGRGGPGASTAGLVPVVSSGEQTPDQAFERYIDAGRDAGTVLGVVPNRTVIDSRPTPDGSGIEVVYLRQIMEREIVPIDQIYRVGRDEFGDKAIVPVEESPVRRTRQGKISY